MPVNPTVRRMAVDFYTKRLIELNPIFVATPAALERLNRQVEALRVGQRRRETNPVWTLPVRVESDGVSPTKFVVLLGEE